MLRLLSRISGAPMADCSVCAHHATLLAGSRCQPGDVCVRAESGRQIDRFFRWNPDLAQDYLADPFWERRAIAVRYASPERAHELIDDTDEVVRRAVATRLPVDSLWRLARDPDREVRITVMTRLPADRLVDFIHDPDYMVRLQVAHRLPHGYLPKLAQDPDREVRKEVARRLPPFALSRMKHESDEEVRRIVAARMLPEDAAQMLGDDDWLVRFGAAGQAPIAALAMLLEDPEPDVRSLVRRRLAETNPA